MSKNFMLVLSMSLFLVTTSYAQVPQMINYQGKINIAGTPFNGNGLFKFSLVNADASTTYWSNDGTSVAGSEPTNAITLSVVNGLYFVSLGNSSIINMTAIPYSVFAHSDVYLRIWFNDGTNGSKLLSPDQKITAVGYAIMANNVDVTNKTLKSNPASDDELLIYDKTAADYKKTTMSSIRSSVFSDYAVYEQQEDSGTPGGIALAGWNTRDLNTTVASSGDSISLTDKKITLKPGVYLITAKACIYVEGSVFKDAKLKLRKVSDTPLDVILGTGIALTANGAHNGWCYLNSILTVSEESSYELYHYVNNSRGDTDLGNPIGMGKEIYANISIIKIGN